MPAPQTSTVPQIPKAITIPAAGKHTATVIFVHGLGDTGHGLKPIADSFSSDPELVHVKWILPHSPIRSVTANMGIEMPSWFDIYSFGFQGEEDEKGMLGAASSINQLITAEIESSGVDPNRIILGGFSQGATMSLLTGLTGERKLAGLAILSGWLPLRKKFKNLASPHAASIPIFWGHGSTDPLVKSEMYKESVLYLINHLGFRQSGRRESLGVSHRIYQGVGHSTSPEELDDLKAWIKNAIPKERTLTS